jgi:Uma2 family endonuclease
MATSPREYRRVMLELLPQQGQWSEEEYLWLTDRAERPVEFNDGSIEVLPMPTDSHQGIVLLFARLLFSYLNPRGGVVRFSPLRLRLRDARYREPDILALLDSTDSRREDRYWHGADWVLEVVSPDKPERDLIEKRREYAEAGIPEYWIVNPLDEMITVLTLDSQSYVEHGIFVRGQQATSALLIDFSVSVEEVFTTA